MTKDKVAKFRCQFACGVRVVASGAIGAFGQER